MKRLMKAGSIIRGVVLGCAVLSLANVAMANPYASGISNNVTAGNVSFRLNEAATDVYVVYGNNAATNDLGALSAGAHTFPLTYNSTTYTNYAINVFNQGSGTFHLISTNSNPEVVFTYARGVAVNKNPQTGNFGRIYVVEPEPGSITYPSTGGGHTRTVTKGIFMLNADLTDAVGQGGTGKLASMIFGSSSIGPNRISVGPDDTVYVGDDDGAYEGGTPAYGVWACAPDISSSVALFATNGAVYNGGSVYGGFDATPRVTGSLTNGTLVLYGIEYDLAGNGTTGDNLWQYNVGGLNDLPDTNAPTDLNSSWNNIGITGVHVDLAISTNGYNNALTYYCTQYRSGQTGVGNNSLTILDQNANKVWDSESAWYAYNGGGDQFNYAVGVSVSPDNSTLAVSIGGAGQVWVMPLTNGIPDLSRCVVHTGFVPAGSYTWAVDWDAANNIYCTVESSSTAAISELVVYDQGQTTLATTANDITGTNGTFNLSYPFPMITPTAPVSVASQNYGSPISGTFTLTRTGNTALPLTVNFTLTGTASNSVYTATSGASTFTSTNGAGKYVTNSIVIPSGQSSVNITITPVADNVPRTTTTVILNVLNSTNYSIAPGGAPTVNIVNTGPQALQVTGVVAPSAYKGLTNDFAAFTITRLGDTNYQQSYTVTNFTYAGTAVPGVDYTTPARTMTNGHPAGTCTLQLGGGVTINPGDVSVIATISPLPNGTSYTGNKSVIIGVAADPNIGYTVPSPTTAAMTIIDNADPVAPVLFADPLTNAVDGNNNDGAAAWRIVYVNTNTTAFPYDSSYVQFGYPLANDGIGLPPNGATTALKVTVNKDGNPGSGAASGAINLYPTNVSFSGNYAIRFNMMMLEGSSGAYATEGPMYGMNHSGYATNWIIGDYSVGQSPRGCDGVWFIQDAEASGVSWGDYAVATGGGTNSTYGYIPLAFNAAGSAVPQNQGGFNAAAYANYFKNSYNNPPGPYTSYPYEVNNVAGIPANAETLSYPTAWADVEMKQVNNKITWSINKTPIYTYVNTNAFTAETGTSYIATNGTLMLGYCDPFASVGSGAAVYYSNLRVVQLGPIAITGITLSGGNVVITFTSTDGDDTTSSFSVLSSGTTGSAQAVDTATTATITQNPVSGVFTATLPQPSTSAVFYRIKHN